MAQNIVQGATTAVKNWWLPLLLGIGLILLGFWVFRNPGGTLIGLATFFTFMLLFSAIVSIAFAISNREAMQGWGWNLAGGILELMLAIVLLRNPGLAGLALNFLLGFWVMFRGIALISFSFEMRDYRVENWGWILVGGILASILAFFILIDPLTGAVTIAVWTGLALVMAGLVNITIAMLLRKVKLKGREIKDAISDLKST